MKKIIVLRVLLFPLYASAQFNKGDVFLGGNLSASLQNTNYPNDTVTNSIYKSKRNSLSVNPSLGYFISSKSAIGVGLGYSTSIQEYNAYKDGYQKIKNHSFSISGFYRYYIPLSNSIFIALQGQLGFLRGTNDDTTYSAPGNNSTESDILEPTYSINSTIKPVFVFFPSPKWGIEAGVGSFGYTYGKTLPDVSHTSSFGLSAGSFTLGIAYYFRKK